MAMFRSSQSLIETPPNPVGVGAIGDRESPRNPFSISAILSDEVGQKRSPPSDSITPPFSFTSVTPLSRNERQRRISQENSSGRSNEHAHHSFYTPSRPAPQGGEMWGGRSVRPSRMSLSEASNLASSPVTTGGPLDGSLSSSNGAAVSQQRRQTTPSHSHNNSITASPFNASLLQALVQQQVTTPTNKNVDILDDSLGMLSTVALMESEISNVNTTSGTSVQERLAGMRINSHHDVSVSSRDDDITGGHSLEASSNTVLSSPTGRKSHTPHILRRDRRRQRKQSLTDSSSGGCGDYTHINTGFLSPLAHGSSDPASKQQFTFSPSIFLSRPNHSSDPSPQHARPTSIVGGNPRHGGICSAPVIPSGNYPIVPLSPSSESDVGLGEEFVTSTPIKSNKENLHGAGGHPTEGGAMGGGGGGGGWSPSILQTSGSSRKQFLREANDASSGSDSELPVKKLKTTPLAHPHQHKRRKSKARTKLSPLLENACSPIAKADHTLQPSPLVTSLTSTPSRADSPPSCFPPHTQAPSTSSAAIGQLRPPISAESAQPPPPVIPVPNYPQGNSPHHTHLAANLLLSQQQPQHHTLQRQPMSGVFPMLHSSVPNQTILSPQTTLINPALSYPFNVNPIMTAFGGFVPMQTYNTAPVCLPGYLPGMSFYNPQVCTAQSMYPSNLSTNVNLVGNTSLVGTNYGKWNGSMCSSPQASSNQRSHLQSVPPWFIFSDKRADSKRSRLSEAINKSLSETPSQKTKLPAEWSKYACGQTHDQLMLTEEARSFLLLRPRQLRFDEEN